MRTISFMPIFLLAACASRPIDVPDSEHIGSPSTSTPTSDTNPAATPLLACHFDPVITIADEADVGIVAFGATTGGVGLLFEGMGGVWQAAPGPDGMPSAGVPVPNPGGSRCLHDCVGAPTWFPAVDQAGYAIFGSFVDAPDRSDIAVFDWSGAARAPSMPAMPGLVPLDAIGGTGTLWSLGDLDNDGCDLVAYDESGHNPSLIRTMSCGTPLSFASSAGELVYGILEDAAFQVMRVDASNRQLSSLGQIDLRTSEKLKWAIVARDATTGRSVAVWLSEHQDGEMWLLTGGVSLPTVELDRAPSAATLAIAANAKATAVFYAEYTGTNDALIAILDPAGQLVQSLHANDDYTASLSDFRVAPLGDDFVVSWVRHTTSLDQLLVRRLRC